MQDLSLLLEKTKEQHMNEAREFMKKFLEATEITNFTSRLEDYLAGNRDGSEVCSFFYALPKLNGMPKRDISLKYFPYESDSEVVYAEVMYRNIIRSETSDILEFLNSSRILRTMIPIVRKHLGKVGAYHITQKVLDRNHNYKVREFAIVDSSFHTPEAENDFWYCAAVNMSLIPESWKTQAKAIGNIERELREIKKGKNVRGKELNITKLSII